MSKLDERRSKVRTKLAAASHDDEIARLTKERDKLREACQFVLDKLESLTTASFRNGGDFEARQRLQIVLANTSREPK